MLNPLQMLKALSDIFTLMHMFQITHIILQLTPQVVQSSIGWGLLVCLVVGLVSFVFLVVFGFGGFLTPSLNL